MSQHYAHTHKKKNPSSIDQTRLSLTSHPGLSYYHNNGWATKDVTTALEDWINIPPWQLKHRDLSNQSSWRNAVQTQLCKARQSLTQGKRDVTKTLEQTRYIYRLHTYTHIYICVFIRTTYIIQHMYAYIHTVHIYNSWNEDLCKGYKFSNKDIEQVFCQI